ARVLALREQDEGDAPRLVRGLHGLAQRIAIHLRHDHVRDDEVGRPRAHLGQPVPAVARDVDGVAFSLEEKAQALRLGGTVFGHQDTAALALHLSRKRRLRAGRCMLWVADFYTYSTLETTGGAAQR